MGQPTKVHHSYETYCELPDDGNRYEVIEGELYVSPAPTRRHQELSKRLEYHLYRWAEVEGRRGEVFYAPFDVILADDTVLQPDLIYVREERRDRFSERGLEGAPDLVVEILSPSTRARDRGLKRETYARHGVSELWLVDPEANAVEVFRLDGGRLVLAGRFGPQDRLESLSVAGLVVPLDDVFRA